MAVSEANERSRLSYLQLAALLELPLQVVQAQHLPQEVPLLLEVAPLQPEAHLPLGALLPQGALLLQEALLRLAVHLLLPVFIYEYTLFKTIIQNYILQKPEMRTHKS